MLDLQRYCLILHDVLHFSYSDALTSRRELYKDSDTSATRGSLPSDDTFWYYWNMTCGDYFFSRTVPGSFKLAKQVLLYLPLLFPPGRSSDLARPACLPLSTVACPVSAGPG